MKVNSLNSVAFTVNQIIIILKISKNVNVKFIGLLTIIIDVNNNKVKVKFSDNP